MKLAFWVYVLQCADGKYYTGQTDDLDRRLAQHQTGGFCDFTSRRRPVRLIWNDYFATRIEALDVERQIKPWSRAKKEALFRGDWAAISFFAKPPHERPSTTLETNGLGEALGTEGLGDAQANSMNPQRNPFVSSEVETSRKTGGGK